jgi:hypothetical protein
MQVPTASTYCNSYLLLEVAILITIVAYWNAGECRD